MRQSKKTMLSGVVGAVLIASVATTSEAVLTIGPNLNAPVQNIPGIAGHVTLGHEMGGMRVTMRFHTGATESDIWEATGPGSGEARGAPGLVKPVGPRVTGCSRR